jgi:putative glycosyltransferase
MKNVELSIVTTLYKSKFFLERFIDAMIISINKLGIDNYEIIFVNDGSPDDSMEYLIEKKNTISQIKIIDLSRNFGHHYAMQAGLSHAKGDYIFLIDNDLDVHPSFIETCFEKMKEDENIDVVYAYQEERKGASPIFIYGGIVFYWLINKISEIKVPKNLLTERLMKKDYVESLLSLGDANLFLGGMMHWAGYKQVGVPVEKKQREQKSTYTPIKSLNLMIQAITSFSGKPLEYLFYFGSLVSLSSFLYLTYIFIQKLIYNNQVIGWTTIVAINILILGVLSTFLGLIGMYLYKIFKQVQNRPNFIIKKIYE